MSKVYFIGDLHLGHPGVLKWGRPEFSSLEEMHGAIVEAWNSVVTKRDTVWVLGDVALKDKKVLGILGHLNGLKKLVLGNHDNFATDEYLKYFKKCYGMIFYKDACLSHMPVHPSQFEFRCTWNIHGHIHAPEEYAGKLDYHYVNVNLDALPDWAPVSWDWCVAKFHEQKRAHYYEYEL